MTPRLAKLIALRDAVKEGRLYDAVSIVKVMQSSAHDRGDIEIMSRSTVEKIMLRKSTDAALAFHAAVLPGWRVLQLHQFEAGHWLAQIDHPQGEDWPKWTQYPKAEAIADLLAVALFLADMAALIAIEEGKG